MKKHSIAAAIVYVMCLISPLTVGYAAKSEPVNQLGNPRFEKKSERVTDVQFHDLTLVEQPTLKLPYSLGKQIDLGSAAVVAQTAGAAFGEDELYFVNNGTPAVFHAVDAATGEVLFSKPVPGADVVWGITVGSDRNVYFSSTKDGILYRYKPTEKIMETLGANPTRDKFIWELEASSDGKVYGATFPQGKVFEYDILSSSFKDLGHLKETEQYARGIGVTDDVIYAGTGAVAHLYKMDRKTLEKEEIPTPFTGQTTMISNVWEYGNRLFVTTGLNVEVLDASTYESVGSFVSNGFVSPPSPYDENIVYFEDRESKQLWQYDMATDKAERTGAGIDYPITQTKTMKWLEVEGVQQLAMLSSRNEYVLYNPQAGIAKTVIPEVEQIGVEMNSLEIGPDSNVYIGGYQSSFTVLDSKTNQYKLQKPNPYQIEDIGFLGGKVYLGTYGGARIYEYDPKKPYRYTNGGPQDNPKEVYAIPDGQSRPYTFASGDGYLFAGTIPDYGLLGGSLAVYDSKKKKWESYRNIIKNQSITGLAYRKEVVYGSSNIVGGLGVTPTETRAKMFSFHVKNKKTETFDLELDELVNPQQIGELAFGPDGLLWGTAWGQNKEGTNVFSIFAMDPKRKTVIKEKHIGQANRGSNYRPFYMRWSPDGFLYTTAGREILVIDPKDLSSVKIASGTINMMDLDEYGNVYFGKGSKLYMMPVPLGKAELKDKKVSLKIGGIKDLKLKAALANGKNIDGKNLKIEYVSSDNEVVMATEDGIKAISKGIANVHAVVSYHDSVIETKAITVKVKQ